MIYEEAQKIAEKVKAELAPHCERKAVPEEKDLFRLIEVNYVVPEKRNL